MLPNYKNFDEEDYFAESQYQNVIFLDKIYLMFQVEVEDFRLAVEKFDFNNNEQV